MSISSTQYLIEQLEKKHDKSDFMCGEKELDHYIKTQEMQDLKKNVSVTYVITEKSSHKILGFYTTSSIGIFPGELPFELTKKLPRYPILPGILLGRLAVDKNSHGQGIGSRLLIDALKRSLDVSEQIGIVAVIVEAKSESAIEFYKYFGFLSLPDKKQRLFLLLNNIKKLNL